uniref:Protein kinase domain-containing protein n=1 Tax=Alexandrium monilatum TaxID=311494 RepID=A0A7S4R8A9_9DINO
MGTPPRLARKGSGCSETPRTARGASPQSSPKPTAAAGSGERRPSPGEGALRRSPSSVALQQTPASAKSSPREARGSSARVAAGNIPPSTSAESSATQQKPAGGSSRSTTVGRSGLEMRVKTCDLAWLNEVLRPAKGPRNRAWKEIPRQPESAEEEDLGVVGYEEIEFKQAIGAGSFGAVWRGNCRGETVAIKQCKVGDKKDADMLLKEIRYLQKLRHPRLVAFLGCCDKPPHVLMLVEYMRGGSLHGLLFGPKKRNPPFAIKVRMAMQVAEGLSYLHDLSIVHRDLKTMNIVMDEELNCKICDFGLTITLEKTHLTVRSLQGSPRYMAPEQFESTARITEKVDIWQMGCVMLELFCLTIPFTHCTGVQQIATELLLRKKAPSVPHDADPRARVLVQACFRIDPKLRPEAEPLREALTSVHGSCTSSGDSA